MRLRPRGGCFSFQPAQSTSCVVVTLRERESLYQWWASHRGSAAVRSPLSVRRQQPASAPCQQINSSQNIITFHTQVFSEVRAACPHREDRDRPVYVECQLNKRERGGGVNCRLKKLNQQLQCMLVCLFMSYTDLMTCYYMCVLCILYMKVGHLLRSLCEGTLYLLKHVIAVHTPC